MCLLAHHQFWVMIISQRWEAGIHLRYSASWMVVSLSLVCSNETRPQFCKLSYYTRTAQAGGKVDWKWLCSYKSIRKPLLLCLLNDWFLLANSNLTTGIRIFSEFLDIKTVQNTVTRSSTFQVEESYPVSGVIYSM